MRRHGSLRSRTASDLIVCRSCISGGTSQKREKHQPPADPQQQVCQASGFGRSEEDAEREMPHLTAVVEEDREKERESARARAHA